MLRSYPRSVTNGTFTVATTVDLPLVSPPGSTVGTSTVPTAVDVPVVATIRHEWKIAAPFADPSRWRLAIARGRCMVLDHRRDMPVAARAHLKRRGAKKWLSALTRVTKPFLWCGLVGPEWRRREYLRAGYARPPEVSRKNRPLFETTFSRSARTLRVLRRRPWRHRAAARYPRATADSRRLHGPNEHGPCSRGATGAMEAAGVEPASANRSVVASTCVVTLSCSSPGPARIPPTRTSYLGFSPSAG